MHGLHGLHGLPALALAGALALSLNQTPGTGKAAAVRFHHLHFHTDDFAPALAAAAAAHGGVRTILEGLGPGIRAGEVYILFERPPAELDDRGGERRESAGARVDAAAAWLVLPAAGARSRAWSASGRAA